MQVMIARKKLKKTQDQVCKEIGICKSILSRIENGDDGKVTKEVMLKLSEALKTPVQVLFFTEI